MGGGNEVCWMRMEYLLTAAAAAALQLLVSLPRGVERPHLVKIERGIARTGSKWNARRLYEKLTSRVETMNPSTGGRRRGSSRLCSCYARRPGPVEVKLLNSPRASTRWST
jgi:hypothetical protein